MGPAPPKEQALTDMEIRRILQQDSAALGNDNSTWVRRSSRQPSKNLINSASVKDLLNRLPSNDSDMVVLKMKKYLSDSDVPPVVMNAALDALEENSNCQALYIQVRSYCIRIVRLCSRFSSPAFLIEFQQCHERRANAASSTHTAGPEVSYLVSEHWRDLQRL
jgi:hypothetical protein